jgi:hypothetical protein
VRRCKGARGRREAAGRCRRLQEASWHISLVPCCSPGKGLPLCNSCALQVIKEYVALPKLGHMLVFETPDGVDSPFAGDVGCKLTSDVRYRLSDGTVKPATRPSSAATLHCHLACHLALPLCISPACARVVPPYELACQPSVHV